MESSKHLLLHFPGHHGNFLSRMFDISSGQIPNFDIFTETGSAHAGRTVYDHKSFKTMCHGELSGEYDNEFALTGKDTAIHFTYKHAFQTVYLLYKANRDRGIDLLDDAQVELAYALTPDVFENRNVLADPRQFNNQYDWLKYSFHVAHALSKNQPQLDYTFELSWIYSYTERFVSDLRNLLDFYQLKYTQDITQHHSKFLQLRERMLNAQEGTGTLFQSAYQEYLNEEIAHLDMSKVGPRYKSYLHKQ